ncbi:hypothetical protein GF351_03155 [Candidatus Woesearchaeota archaeon]|nr:hypothetical protein [Candidatus Woesearchaeota archaeon]
MGKQIINNDMIAYMLIVLIGFSLTSIYHEIQHKRQLAAESITGIAQGTVSATILPPPVPPVIRLDIALNPDNQSSDLNWTDFSADHYLVYYSSNISLILNLDPDNVPGDVTVVNASTATNWTDTNARDEPHRYYRITAVKSGMKNLSYDSVGTCYLDLVKGFNLIGLCMNASYSAESFMQGISHEIYLPSLTKLERPNEFTESWISKTLGYGVDYDIEEGEGYLLSLDHTTNYTIVGDVFYGPHTLQLAKGYNLVSIDGHKAFTAESFLQNISSTIYLPSLTKLERPNEFTESWISKTLGYGVDYPLFIGEGYLLSLDHYYNYTLE